MKKIKTIVLNIINRVLKQVDDLAWTRYKNNKLLVDVSPEKRPMYDVLLNNLRYYLLSVRADASPTNRTNWFSKFRKQPTQQIPNEVWYKITKRALDKLEILNLVGVQPMQAPVGLLYAMHYAEVEENGENKQRLQIVSKAVHAQTRRLNARISIEAVSDLKMLHGIDFVEDMSNVLAQEIDSDINSAILDDLCNMAVPTTFDASTHMNTIADARKFVLAVSREANLLARETQRGPGNWVVVDAHTCSMLQSYAKDLSPAWVSFIEEPTFQVGSLLHVGYILGDIKLYVSIAFKDKALVGYKGSSEVDTGYIFSPYILCMATGVMIDPETFQPLIGIGTRYGVTVNDGELVRGGQYYRQINFATTQR